MRLMLVAMAAVTAVFAQSDPRQLTPVLDRRIQTSDVTAFQLRQYAMRRTTPLRSPSDAGEWAAEATRIRRHLLDDVIFHGWPKAWVNAPPRFEKVGIVNATDGYRATKLRYEIVPGFYSTAILYEPLQLTGRVPAILNVNGHVGAVGKAAEYKQKRCINFARQGMLALSLEWIGMGELGGRENGHSYAAHLDLVGTNGVGLFYLAMRRGLDYLDQHPNADRARLGVTGLSGGGWQTITLSSLDERVAVAVPVAGFSSLVTGIEHPEYVGNDMEQNPTDFRDGQDYAHLAAMRAPRPTLLIYNAEDDCCFRAGIVKPGVFEQTRPFFRLFGKESEIRWHENQDPGTHNYQLDNRQQAYAFFAEKFGLPPVEREIPVDSAIKTFQELEVGLPKDNLTVLGVAKRLAQMNGHRTDLPANGAVVSERTRLSSLIRYRPVTMQHAWAVATTKSKGVETRSYLFEFNNGLCATGVWSKAIATRDAAPLTVVLRDAGKRSAVLDVSDYVDRGEQALAVDLLFIGDNTLDSRIVPHYTQLLAAMGDRPAAMEAAQLLAIRTWLKDTAGAPPHRLQSTGLRSQVISLLAAALEPASFNEVVLREGIRSLSKLLEEPVTYENAPDLFCLDLYKEFDLPRLAALAGRTRIVQDPLPFEGQR